MATRAHLREQITSDKIGALTPVAFATVSVFQTGTTTPVTGTLFSTATGAGTLANPVTADANGVVEFWMTSPQVVDLSIVAAGYNSATVTAQVIGASVSTGVVSLNTTTALSFAGDVLITGEDLTYEGASSAHTVVTLDRAQTISGSKNFSALQEFSGGVSPDGTHTLTLPAATDTLVGKATADTLTNKTLTTPVITGPGGTLTLPVGPDTLVGRATTDTLTNKSIDAGQITGTLGLGQGGTGAGALAQHGVVTAGASALGTVAPGSSGNLLTSNGTDWVSQAALSANPTLISGGSTASSLSNVTTFVGVQINATESFVQIPMARAVTLTKLYVVVTTAPGAGQTFTFTVRKNGVDQAITCVISGTNTNANDTAHSVAFAAGDLLSVKAVGSATAANNGSVWYQVGT